MSTETCIAIVTRGDRLEWLREALESISKQNLETRALVVVNRLDAPTAALLEITSWERALELDIRFAEGPGPRTADGMRRVLLFPPECVKYVGLMFDDGVLYPDHVSRLVATLKNRPELDAAYADSARAFCNAKNKPMTYGDPFRGPFTREQLIQDNWGPLHAFLFRREAWARLSVEPAGAASDWAVLLSALHDGCVFGHAPGPPTSEYRIRGEPGKATTNNDGPELLAATVETRAYWRKRFAEGQC